MTASAETPQAEWKLVPAEPTEAMCRAGESCDGSSSPEGWLDGGYTPENVELIYRAMLAASPAPQVATATPMQVKPLEWDEQVSDYWWVADFYLIERQSDGIFSVRAVLPGGVGKSRTIGTYATIEAAKAAAQADYACRINSALVTADDRTALEKALLTLRADIALKHADFDGMDRSDLRYWMIAIDSAIAAPAALAGAQS